MLKHGVPSSGSRRGRGQLIAGRLRSQAELKLGRCLQCMTASAMLFLGSWMLLFHAVTRVRPGVIGVASVTIVALLFSALALAHALAYALRRFGHVGLPPIVATPEKRPVPAAPPRRGCGCGG